MKYWHWQISTTGDPNSVERSPNFKLCVSAGSHAIIPLLDAFGGRVLKGRILLVSPPGTVTLAGMVNILNATLRMRYGSRAIGQVAPWMPQKKTSLWSIVPSGHVHYNS